ncbi:MAG: ATP-binding cassette domain-containing protein [Acetobacteraceae bacterium]
MAALLEIRNVRKRFGAVDALKGVSFELNAGEVVAVVGDNGAGKSTLMKIISGVYAPDSGELVFEGSPVRFASPKAAREAGIETIYQDLALADHLDIGANIFLGREPLRRFAGIIPVIDEAKVHEEVVNLLARVESHIPDPDVRVMALSGGQRQAVAIARALYWKAKVVIMDEPTAALAAMETRNVLHMARGLAGEGVGVLFIGHNLIEILEVSDRVVVMQRGAVVHECRASETDQEQLVRHMTGRAVLREARAG